MTGLLTFLTSVVYLAAYTPLKRISPICTFVGAFPGAMPGVLGWTAVRGHLEWGTLVLFAILFIWQFPHFFSIAWLYREDYANGGVKMLPVVEDDGRSTARRILAYSIALIPISVLPSFMGMAGKDLSCGSRGARRCTSLFRDPLGFPRATAVERTLENARPSRAAGDGDLLTIALRADDGQFAKALINSGDTQLGCEIRAYFFASSSGGPRFSGNGAVNESRNAIRSSRSSNVRKSSARISLSRCGFRFPPPM